MKHWILFWSFMQFFEIVPRFSSKLQACIFSTNLMFNTTDIECPFNHNCSTAGAHLSIARYQKILHKIFFNWQYFRYELMEDPNQAIEWLMQLISVVPTDSHALAKLGELYDSEGDKSQAFQYYYEVGILKITFPYQPTSCMLSGAYWT